MPAGLNIAALAQRTGVAPDTLRKWEQRYHILQPSRTPGGQRRYSERDVARVEWLRERLEEGYRISEAASLLGEAVEPARSTEDQVRAMLASLDRGEAEEIGVRLDQAFALNGVEETLERIVRPLLEQVGERWAHGDLTVAEEHLVSETVRSRLGHLLADVGGGVRGVAVLACAPGERHELGLMMATIALRRDGWKVFYLGCDTPPEDALALARRVSARVVGWSVSAPEHGDALVASDDDDVAVVVGGPGATPELAERLGATHVGAELPAVVAALRKLSV
jgi:DNA-binding transcriptional MerR regulator/methylmalonyl-CoA mutase cobalamin-binding subunit